MVGTEDADHPEFWLGIHPILTLTLKTVFWSSSTSGAFSAGDKAERTARLRPGTSVLYFRRNNTMTGLKPLRRFSVARQPVLGRGMGRSLRLNLFDSGSAVDEGTHPGTVPFLTF